MTDAAIIRATYETYRHVPSRKVVQIVLEVPAEGQAEMFKAIGYPNPAASVWVAVALLRTPDEPEAEPETAQLEPPRPQKSLAQIAGIICSQQAFWKYINVADADAAADYVRGHCNVSSRAALDHNEDAATAFRTLNTDYKLWLDGRDLAA